jgi:hypothetical protein
MTTINVEIPRVIYSLWLDGEDKAPDLVRVNFTRWTKLNPHYKLKVLDRSDAEAILQDTDLPLAKLAPQALSDIVRARLLLDNGGIWVDASVLPVQPLEVWLPKVVTESGLFAFERPGPCQPISSWFLAATPRNVIFCAWWNEIKRFWLKPRRLIDGTPADPVACVAPEAATKGDEYPYFWFIYFSSC